MMKQLLILATLTFTLGSQQAGAQTAGMLDTTFSVDGKFTYDLGSNDNLSHVTLQADGKIICTGVSLTPAFAGVLTLIRLNPDGTLDDTFGNNGVFTYLSGQESYGVQSFVKPDGKIIITGINYDSTYNADMLLVQINPNGTYDLSFGNNGVVLVDGYTKEDLGQALAVQADGKILVSGTWQDTVNYYNLPTIVRFNEDGSIDASFGNNGVYQIGGDYIDNELTSLSVQPDGKIVAAGHFEKPFNGSSDFDILLLRVNTNGTADASFGTNGVVKTSIHDGIDDSFGMKLDSLGNIIVAGFTTNPTTYAYNTVLLKYLPTGVLDLNFGTNGMVELADSIENYANDLKIQYDNKILVGGSYGSFFSGVKDFALWRFLPNGTLDANFGANGVVYTDIAGDIDDCNSMTLQDDGAILAVGKGRSTTNFDMAVVRYFGGRPTSGVNELKGTNLLTIYPNPAKAGQYISLQLPENTNTNGKVSLCDLTGNVVSNSQLVNGKLLLPASLAKGMYSLQFATTVANYVAKLVVE